jgi:hypothetical protein
VSPSDRTVPPAPDELEISLFGPGVGECVVVHLGDNEWFVVDSCLNPETRNSVALEYFDALGVDVSTRVKGVVATHWHQDHYQGLGDLFARTKSAKFFCSAALQNLDFIRYVVSVGMERVGTQQNAIHEFEIVLAELKRRAPATQRMQSVGPEWALDGKELYRRHGSNIATAAFVQALSPSSATISLAFHEIAELLPTLGDAKRRPVAQGANELSIAIWVSVGGVHALLGGDLETGSNPATGWNAVVGSNLNANARADCFKIPHHGSDTAHHNDVWTSMLGAGPVSIVAPFFATANPLPTQRDISRLKNASSAVYCSTRNSPPKSAKRIPAVEKTIKNATKSLRGTVNSFGQVRIRASSRAPAPSVELFGSAQAL